MQRWLARVSMEPEKDPDFDWYVSCLPASHWSKYDLSAVRQGWDAHKAFIEANPEGSDGSRTDEA
jgi:hypothetical protein